MRPVTLTFIGGPEAGRRMKMENKRDYVRFNVCPPMGPIPPYPHEPLELLIEQFTYRVEKLPGDVYVAFPNEWYDDKGLSDGWYLERVMRELVRGYVGSR